MKTLDGQTIVIHTDTDDLIEELKAKIEDMQGIPIDAQRLIFKTRELADGHSLSDYKIQDKSTLYLVLRMRGSPDESSKGEDEIDESEKEEVRNRISDRRLEMADKK